EFQFASLVNASAMVLGRQRTTVDYDLGLKVERELTSDNFPDAALVKGKDGQAVLKRGHDHIQRLVTAEVRKEITIDETSVLTMFQSDTLLLADVFEPAKALKVSDFQTAFPSFDEQALAGYLEPLLKTTFKNEIKENTSGSSKTVEVTKTKGGGFGIS